jgi:predicted dinucleotide-binding enzyme
MRIGIIGSGRIGGTLARLLARAGHEVAIANSRGPESLRDLIAEIGSLAQAADVDGAAEFGDVVILAAPWRAHDALPSPSVLAGKIVVDAMNPYTGEGGLFDLGDDTSSEVIARRLPGTRLVKAFNTIHWQRLGNEGRPGTPVERRLAAFLAGDDPQAKGTIARLIEEIGFAPIDTGTLREGGRRQEPGTALYNRPLTGEEATRLVAQDNP